MFEVFPLAKEITQDQGKYFHSYKSLFRFYLYIIIMFIIPSQIIHQLSIILIIQNISMDLESGHTSKNHGLFYDPQDPMNTLVVLKKKELMEYFYQQDLGTNKKSEKFFPNYYILSNIQIAHKQKMLRNAMLNQKTKSSIMIQQFCNLAKTCYKNSAQEIDLFAHRSQNDNFTVNDILKNYTSESFFYRLLNRLLRAGKGSTELYYAQHFMKLLSKSIKQVYQQQKKQKQKQVAGDFKCYRGAFFSDKQLDELRKNVGKHIETLGFMSTSIDQQVAENFLQKGNTMVQIMVSDTPKDEELDLGFAYLSYDYSTLPYEQQVLFNVLGSFQIKNVKTIQFQGKDISYVQLEYGVTYQLAHKYKTNNLQKSSAEQQLIIAILQWQKWLKQHNNQELCLLKENAVDEYIWLKKTKIALLKSIPSLAELARLQQYDFYNKLTTNQIFKGKELEFQQEIKPKYLISINSQITNESTIYLQFGQLNLGFLYR